MAVSLNAKLTLSTASFIQSLNKAEKRLQRSGRKMMEVGNRLAMSVAAPLLSVGGAALSAFADMEKFSNGLESMMGSSEAAAAELKELKKIAQAPGLDLRQAVKGSVRLQSVGIEAAAARDVLSQAGNAIALVGGSSDDLDGVTLALQQIGAKGKVSAEEINQINERLPQIRGAMKAAFGTANTEEIQEMELTSAQFIAGITEELAKLPRATGGLSNAFNNMQQGVVQALSTIGGSIEKNFDISGKLNAFSTALNNIADRFANLSPKAQKMILLVSAFAAAIGPLLVALGSLKTLLSVSAGGLSVLATAYGRILILKNAFTLSTIKATAAMVANKIAVIAENVALHALGATTVTVNTVTKVWATVTALVTGKIKILTVAQRVLNMVMKANPIGLVIVAIMGLITAFTAAYQNIKWFRDGVDKSLKFLKDVFGNLLKRVQFIFANMPAIFSAFIVTVGQFAENVVLYFKRVILSAQEFKLKFQRALTVNKNAREEITKAIDELKAKKTEFKAAAKGLGETFRDELSRSMAGISEAPDTPTTRPKDATAPDVPTFSPKGEGFKAQEEAATKAKTAVLDLANAQQLVGVAFTQSLAPIGKVSKKLDALPVSVEAINSKTKEMALIFNDFKEQLVNIVNEGFVNVTSGFAEMIGQFAAGQMSLKSVGVGMVGMFADILGQIGKLAIKTGVAMLGIQAALKAAFSGPAGPAAAIVAGGALVALSAAVKSKISSVTPMAKGGIVLPTPGGTIAQIGEAGKAEAVIPLDRLGQMIRGGNGITRGEFRIKGRDLVYVLNLENEAMGRSF